jgi:hypothetical protein
MKRILLGLSFFALLFAACKKAETPESFEDKLRSGQWKRTALTLTYRSGTGAVVTDNLFRTMDTCRKDNTLEFKANYAGLERKNVLKCSAGDADETPFTWEIFNSGKNIRIYNVAETFYGENAINADIMTLTSNELTIRYQFIERDPLTHDADTFTLADTFRK